MSLNLLRTNELIISINDFNLFAKLNTVYNRIWFTIIYESKSKNLSSEVTVFYSNACWESKFFFYDFFNHHPELKYRIA